MVIGAMVIARLLGPNLAFCLAVALGDRKLMGRAMLKNLFGISLTLFICIVIGTVWPSSLQSGDLMDRINVGYDGLALATASGAAATLSLLTGLSSALVGVMVAVALLPPAATMGLIIGAGQYELALGAALLLAVNVVCVNLASQVTFVLCGITPRTWLQKEATWRGVRNNLIIWILLLCLLIFLLTLRVPNF